MPRPGGLRISGSHPLKHRGCYSYLCRCYCKCCRCCAGHLGRSPGVVTNRGRPIKRILLIYLRFIQATPLWTSVTQCLLQYGGNQKADGRQATGNLATILLHVLVGTWLRGWPELEANLTKAAEPRTFWHLMHLASMFF